MTECEKKKRRKNSIHCRKMYTNEKKRKINNYRF